MSIFDSFTRKYALSKTLRFELKPVGNTRTTIEKTNPKFIHDQEIEDAYQVLKPVFDKLHEEFITKGLAGNEAKKIDIATFFDEYRKFRNEQDRDEKIKIEKDVVKAEKDLRDVFKSIWEKEGENFKTNIAIGANLKEKSYKILTEAGILKFIKSKIDDFAKMKLKTRDGKLVEKADLEKALGTANSKGVFDGFFTYLSGFNQNRENYYSVDEKSTAIANRVVGENLPKFCDNVMDFEKRKDEYLKIYEFLGNTNIELKGKSQDGQEVDLEPIDQNIFKIGHFVNCLSQPEIEKYNLQIGNVNFLVNLYNQQKKDEQGFKKLPKFKTLYKQIGCGEKGEYIPAIKSDHELEEILKKVGNDGVKFFCEVKKFTDEILKLDSFEGVYWSEKALNIISAKYFANWGSLKEMLRKSRVFKKEKDEIKVPQTIELSDLFNVLDNENEIFKDSFKDNDGEKQKIKNNDNLSNSKKLLKMIFVDIDANKMIFDNRKYEVSQITEYKKDESTQKIKDWLDAILFSNQILKYFKVRENKVRGAPLNSEIYELLDEILFDDNNPTNVYDIVRNYLTKKPTEELNKLKLNFENAVLAGGWDVNKEPERRCIILKDKDDRKYLVILTDKTKKFFEKKPTNNIYVDQSDWQKMDYKLLPGPNKMLPKVFISSAKWKIDNTIPREIEVIYKEGRFKKGDNFSQVDLGKLVDYFKDCLNKYEWGKTFDFKFSDTTKYASIDQFYSEVEKQGYKLHWSGIRKELLDKKVEDGEIFLFEIRNKDNNLKDGKAKTGGKNLHTMYWNAVFGNAENKPKLNGEAEIFYRPKVEGLMKDKDKAGNVIGASKKRFEQEKFVFHCPITLNFCLKSSNLNDEINKTMAANIGDICFIGIDRGEKHLAYYSVINGKSEILDQGSFNEIEDKNTGKKHNYAEKLEEKAGNRDEARKNWKTIGTIKELKDGYISQVVRKIVDLAVKYNAYIVLEDLNIGFKRGRQKIEKSVYQKLELALAKKLNFLVDKKAKDGDILSVEKALQLTPPVANFQDIGKQCGIMLYIRANYTSQTDPITGWRKTIYFNSSKQEDLKAEICDKFDEIRFDGKDYFFTYTTKYEKTQKNSKKGRKIDFETGKTWTMWSGKDGKSLDRYKSKKNEHGVWEIVPEDIVELLNEVFIGFDKEKSLLDQILDEGKLDNSKVPQLKYAIELIQQIRNSGPKDPHGKPTTEDDFILSPVRDENGNHFDSRELGAIVPNGDANGAYNIARKGLMAFEKKYGICEKPEKPDLYIEDKEWDKWLVGIKE